jgi:hypothetical protein
LQVACLKDKKYCGEIKLSTGAYILIKF